MGLINAIVMTIASLSSTRVRTVVISNGAYLIVAIAVPSRNRNNQMTNINSGINLNKVLLQVHWKNYWHGTSKQRSGHSSSCCCFCTNIDNINGWDHSATRNSVFSGSKTDIYIGPPIHLNEASRLNSE